ncbi:MAG TPA: serine/threonine-protein kinase [Kofleriaceae bacterium]|nr:serine/threonine-protein kinase [Kofleriaceae bacterium]
MPGQTIGGYRILDKLGEGGMGKVYAAAHELLGKKVAIKVLLPQHSQNAELVQRFFNEARAATRINHPGIVEIFDFGRDQDGSAYIVMEYLRGESLAARLEREHTLSPAMVMRIIGQVTNALGQAHREGIIHRDLKPDNIFLVPDPDVIGGERAKILDFGIAKLTEDATAGVKTRAGVVIGTPTYMAPEQFRAASSVDHRADIYALGVVLYEMLTGRPPFMAEGLMAMMEMHMFESPPPPRSLVPALSQALEQVVLRALAKRPEDRQASAEELARELAAAVGDTREPSAPTLVPPGNTAVLPLARPSADTTLGAAAGHALSTSPGTRPGSRRPGRWIAAGAVAALGITIGVVLATDNGGSAPPAPPDAMPIASTPPAPPAPPDAAPPDAALPDAALPDAALPDAARPDAALPDAAPPTHRPRQGVPGAAPPTCDRTLDLDCDGIPDVR